MPSSSPSRLAHPRCTNGGGTPNRWIRSKIAANNSRGTATSAIWKITYRELVTTLAPILINFSRSVVSDQCLTDLGTHEQSLELFYVAFEDRGDLEPCEPCAEAVLDAVRRAGRS